MDKQRKLTLFHLQFLAWFDVLADSKVDVAAVLICDEVLLSRIVCRTYEHHPVALVLIMGINVLRSTIVFLHLSLCDTMSYARANAAFTPDNVARIQVVSTCIPCRRLHVSCIGDKIVIKAALRRHVSTCIRIQVARPGYLYVHVPGVNAA